MNLNAEEIATLRKAAGIIRGLIAQVSNDRERHVMELTGASDCASGLVLMAEFFDEADA